MNKIQQLLQQLCPNGVEFTELGRLGVFENIGVDKKIIEGQKKVKLLNFMDVMRNKHITKKVLTMEVSASDSKIEKCDIKKHDIFITPTSETRDEIGFAAVVDEDIPDSVYSYHIMRYRLFEKNDITPYFISYLFEAESLRTQIFKASKGLTRYGLSGKDFGKLQIPIPPLPIQQEIVKILDSFTQLEAELEAELEARRAQYEYYRNKLLNATEVNGKWLMNGVEVEWKTLGEVSDMKAGKSISATDISNIKTEENLYPCIGGNGIRGFVKSFSHSGNYPIIGRQGALCGNIFYSQGDFYATEHAVVVNHKGLFNSRFLFYLLTIMNLNQYATGGAQPGLAVSKLEKLKIPIPPLSEQNRIVEVLDKFDALVNDISIGLPAEIEARRKQYEYYRGKLLTFKQS